MSKELEIFNEMESTYLYGNGGDLWLELKAKSEVIRKVLTPPTEQEVCKALSEYFGCEVKYRNNDFYRTVNRVTQIGNIPKLEVISLRVLLKEAPHLITLISRFYESRTSNDNK